MNDVTSSPPDARDYHLDPRSSCCQARIVYFLPAANRYVTWDGRLPVDAEALRCSRCSKTCEIFEEDA